MFLQEKIDTIHEQVIRGDIRNVRRMLDKKGWATARDHYGHSPLHKAVMANQEEVMKFIIESYPEMIEVRDNVSIVPKPGADPDGVVNFGEPGFCFSRGGGGSVLA